MERTGTVYGRTAFTLPPSAQHREGVEDSRAIGGVEASRDGRTSELDGFIDPTYVEDVRTECRRTTPTGGGAADDIVAGVAAVVGVPDVTVAISGEIEGGGVGSGDGESDGAAVEEIPLS